MVIRGLERFHHPYGALASLGVFSFTFHETSVALPPFDMRRGWFAGGGQRANMMTLQHSLVVEGSDGNNHI